MAAMSTHRIRFNLDITMWNEGVGKVHHPWLTVYTEPPEIAQALGAAGPYEVPDPESSFHQGFDVEHDELATADAAALQQEIDQTVAIYNMALEDVPDWVDEVN